MKHIDEFRKVSLTKALVQKLQETIERPMKIMEVCGTHTMAIHSSGVKSLLNKQISLVSGPGCPVCVTEKLFIDQAMFLAEQLGVCLITFGDLIRVPGSHGSLADLRSRGGLVKVVYSPMDSIEIALALAPQPVVFLGIGFETTIPTVAVTVKTCLLYTSPSPRD